MTSSKPMTKKQVLTLAIKKFGDSAYLEENTRAFTKQQRDDLRQAIGERRDILKVVKEQLAALGNTEANLRRLLAATQEVIDFNGNEAAMRRVRLATAEADRFLSLTEERLELEEWIRKNTGSLFGYRCRVLRNAGWANMVEAEGDTWDECAAKLEVKS